MAHHFLLDTMVLSDLVRNPGGAVAARIGAVGEATVCTSVVVACELRFGAAKSGSPRLAAQLEKVLACLDILPLEAGASHDYARIRAQLERTGTPIGPNDLLIAAHALALSLTLVSDNVREFQRVPGLRLENWLEA